MSQINDLTGREFGRLTVLSKAESKGGRAYWNCQCTCGKVFIAKGRSILIGDTSSCGCLRTDQLVARSTTHGKSKTRTFFCWTRMRRRCTKPNSPDYKYYGGRGIKVCERWEKFENFLVDMGEMPEGLTLERKDVNGNYEPSNVKWATWTEQNQNTRATKFVTINGIRLCLAEWRRRNKISDFTYRQRLKKGWSVEAALTIKPRAKRK